MKKTHAGRIVPVAALLICFIALFTTCKNNIGMGGTIDINPPTIKNDSVYPPNNAIIKGAFKLAVKADDDTGVNAVTAVITTANVQNSKINIGNSFLQRPSSKDGYWTLDIDPKGEYPIGDGSYKVEIQATDTAGKVAAITSAFTIDNTPPLLVLDRPSTAGADVSNTNGDAFGDVFWLIGQVYDKSAVAKLEITASPVGGGTEYTKVIKNVPANIRLKVDAFSEDKTKSQFYCALYGTNQSAGKKNFRYSLKVTDDAREYKSPGGKAGSGTGNETNIYYLKDDIDKDVMRNRRLQDVYAVLYGTPPASISAEDAENMKAALNNPANRLGGGVRTGVFGLNPSLNPTFAVIGKTPSKEVSGTLTPEFSKFYEGASLQVRFSRNLDDVALKPVDPATPANDPYQFYLVKWETYRDTYSHDPSFNINEDASKPGIVRIQRTAVEMQDGSYVFTIPVHKTGELEYNKNYVLLVSGKDIDGHELIAVQNEDGANLYGIKLSSTNEPPEVTVTEINGNTNVTERIFVKKGASVKFKITLNKSAEVTHKLIGAASPFTPPAVSYPATDAHTPSHEIEIPASAFDQTKDGSYRLTVKAEADGAESFDQTYHIVYDVTVPEVRITYPVGNLYRNEGNGLVIKGTAFDTGSGLADTDPVTVTLTAQDGGHAPVLTFVADKKREEWELQPITLPEGKYTLTVTAKDKVGFESTANLEFTYDKAAPEIKDVKIDDKDDSPVINKTGTFKVKGSIEETYGIKSCTIGDQDYTFSPSASSPYFFEQELTREEGSYDIAITVKDKADNQTSETKTVIVDKTPPVFESIKIATTENVQNGDRVSTNSGTVAIKGKIKEEGSGVKKLEYKVEGEPDWQELSAAKKTDGYYFEGSADIPVNTVKKLLLKVTDNADWPTEWKCTVKVVLITASLTLEVDNSPTPFVNTNGAYYRKSPVKLKIAGTTNDASSVPLTVTVKNSGGNVPLANFFSAADASRLTTLQMNDTGSPIFTTKNDLDDGEYTITVSGGSADPKTVALVIDTKGPAITAVTPQNRGVITAGYEIQTALSDISGIKEAKAYYQKEGGVRKEIALPAVSPYKAVLPTPLAEGKYEVWFSAKDNLENEAVSAKMTVWNDSAPPSLTDVKVNTETGNTVYIKNGDPDVSITGKATDSYGIARVGIWVGSTEKLHTETIQSDGSWTLTFTGSDALADGTHNLTIRATDKAGKIAEVQRTVVVDRQDPTLSITKLGTTIITDNNFTAFSNGYVAEGGLLIGGKAKDTAAGASGIDFVRYIFNDGTDDIGTIRSLDLNSSGAFSQMIQVPAAAKKLKLICADRAGNKHEIPITLKVDSKAPNQPVITDVNGKGNTPTIIVSGKETAGITIHGTVSDDETGGTGTFSGIKEIRWKLDTASGTATLNTGVTPNTYTWTVTIPKASIKGGSVIITAADNAGYTSAPTVVTFLQDTQPPTAKITNFDSFTAQTGDTLVKGSVTDQGTAGVLPEKTKWKIVKQTETAPTVDNPGGDWKKVDKPTVGNWEITNLPLATYFTESGGSYTSEYAATHGDPSDGLFDLPLYLWVEDASENKAVIKLTILVDPAGDRPTVTIISPLSPVDSATPLSVGGQVAVYGSATVKTGSVGEVYMDVSTDPNFGSFISDWHDKKIEGTGSWNTVLNKDKEISDLITGTDRTKIIYYRVRAKNGNSSQKWGGYSAVQKLLFDKGAPVIQSAKFHKDNNAAGTDYKEKEWITGDDDYLTFSMSDETGIKTISITKTVNGNPTEETLEGKTAIESYQIDGQTVFTAGTAHGDYNDYTAQFPLKTSTLAGTGGEYSITITVQEGTATGTTFLTQTATYTFNFDKKEPSGYIGEYVDAGNSVFSGTTLPSILNTAKVGQYLYVNKQKVKIVEDSTPGTKKLEQSVNGKFDWVLYKDRDYFTGTSAIIRGIAYDEGTSGVAKITGYIKNGTTKLTGTDFTVEKGTFKKPIGDFITWEQSVPIPTTQADGKYTLTYTVEDGNGNKSAELTQFIYIKRKGIHISKVSLGTDLNRSNAVEAGSEEVVAFTERNDGTVQPKQDERTFDWSGEIDASSFVFKRTDSTHAVGTITVEYTGGNTPIKYTLKKGSTVIKNNELLPSGNIIPLTQAEFTLIGTGDIVLDLELTDSCGWKSSEKIRTRVDTSDSVKPKGGVLPLFWNDTGANKNSIAWNGTTAEGHISYEGYNTTPNTATPTWTNKPAVSGKIIVSGYAYDETLLKQITVTAGGMSVLSTFKKDAANGWEQESSPPAGLTLKVTTQKLNQTGHYAFWELTWDTSKITNGVGSNISVSVTAEDTSTSQESTNKIKVISGTAARGGSGTDLTTEALDNADADLVKVGQTVRLYSSDTSVDGYYVFIKSKDEVKVNDTTKKLKLDLSESVDKTITKYQIYTNTADTTAADIKSATVDVVPYITGVSRNGTYNTKRARSGAIPLLRGEAGNTITGFNFAAGSGTSLKITEHKDGSGASVSMDNLTLSSDKKSFTFDVPDGAKDGYLHLEVNNVAAVNNTNAYTATNTEDSDTYGTAKHSDDRLVHIWRVNAQDTFKGSKNAIYPAMTKNSDGTLYASFSNYSKSSVYYSNKFTGDTPVVVAGNGTTRVFNVYDPPEETDITVNGTEVNVLYAANYHGGGDNNWGSGSLRYPWNDTHSDHAGGIYLYDKDANHTYKTPSASYKGYRFELFTYDNELQQFKNIRTVRSGDNIYVVYYDRLTAAVKFSWVDDSKKPDTSVHALPWCVIDGNTDVTDTNSKVPDAPATAPANQKTFTFVSPNGTSYKSPYVLSNFEDGLSVSTGVWESIAVTVTKNGYPVVVYMDAATGSLRLARSTKTQPTSSDDWKIQSVLASSDTNGKIVSDYINACIGSDGYLHIAFQNTRGQLVYVKSTNTSDDGSTKYTFGDSEVLDDSGTFIDMTMDGATPYISYVFRPNSYDAIRIAYKTTMDFNNAGTDVEGWETMTAPLNQRAASGRICIATKAKHYNTTEKMPVAVGFKTNSDYRAAFYVGK